MIRWQRTLATVAIAVTVAISFGRPAFAAGNERHDRKLDKALAGRTSAGGASRVIVTLQPGADASDDVKKLGGKVRRQLPLINALAIELPNAALRSLAARSAVVSLHDDRPTGGELNRTAVSIGARAVRADYGYTGAGVGVAVIDSGITSWHNDLTQEGTSSLIRTKDGKRVAEAIDFVSGLSYSYDDNGHGTHVAGIIAGNGRDSLGAYSGVAPAAHLLSLKVLDQRGRGVISDVIAALKWVYDNRPGYNIRVVNLSVGAAVTESYRTDPLALAVKRVVDAGVVVVCAAGNLGKNALGQTQYGGITAPGNAPWVITVGAYSHEGTVSRSDDVIAPYSSRGPSAIDFQAKPDLVAPGSGIVSMADAASLMYASRMEFLLKGSPDSSTKTYLSLSGTSMAAPVVSGTVALMMQANPSLTPNMVKAIVQYTAQKHASYDSLTQGSGFLNTYGAVQLARFFRTATSGSTLSIPGEWSKEVIWGNRRITGGVIRPNANAFQRRTTWGASVDVDGDNIVWGTLFGDDADNIVWGTFDTLGEDNIVWGTLRDDDGDNIVWGTHTVEDNIVWGSEADVENIVWGTDCGGADCENIVWGSSTGGSDDNIVWGTAEYAENIVWGSDGRVENVAWRTSSEADNITWGNASEQTRLFDDPDGAAQHFDHSVWRTIFLTEPVRIVPVTGPVTTSVAETTTILGGGF